MVFVHAYEQPLGLFHSQIMRVGFAPQHGNDPSPVVRSDLNMYELTQQKR